VNAERLEKYAELAVRVGANVQEGQEVFLSTIPEHADVARALTRQAYRAGASYVNVYYDDAHVRHAMIGLGPDSALTYSPEWRQEYTRGMAGNALLATSGNPEPELLADLDGDRVGRAMQVEVAKIRRQQHHDNTVNWCGVGAPNAGWAQQVLGEPDVERLWELVATCFRLDEDDPVAAWTDRMETLKRSATALSERRFDAIHLHGPGTDLTVGLFKSSIWHAAEFTTLDGLAHYPNVPSEETFTTPDPVRVDGYVSATLPLELYGSIIKGLRVEFRRTLELCDDLPRPSLRSRCQSPSAAFPHPLRVWNSATITAAA